MNISRNNYEAWFLDYHENNLSKAQVEQLMAFLDEHPELKEEFESFEFIELMDETSPSFPDKESLKKKSFDICDAKFDDYCIAALEGDLEPEEHALLLELLEQDPQAMKTFEMYQKTLLEADKQIIFSQKNRLKKETPTESSKDIDEQCIAWMEGDMNTEQKQLFQKQLDTLPHVSKDLKLYEASRSKADLDIRYPNKRELKRFTIGLMLHQAKPYLSIAAALLFIASVLWFINPGSEPGTFVAEDIRSTEATKEIIDKIHLIEEVSIPEARSAQEKEIRKVITPIEKTKEIPKEVFRMPEPFLLASLEPTANIRLQSSEAPTQIDYRDEFAYYFHAARYENEREDAFFAEKKEKFDRQEEREFVSFARLAERGVEQITGVKVNEVSEDIASGRLGLWDLAGLGLAGLSQVSGTSFAVEKQRDENGRLTTFAIGNKFRIER